MFYSVYHHSLLTVLLLLGINSFGALAAQADENGGRVKRYRYSCELDNRIHQQDDLLCCRVSGEICLRRHADTNATEPVGGCRPKDTSIKVVCDSGFKLSDETATLSSHADKLLIEGTEDPWKALLEVSDDDDAGDLTGEEGQQALLKLRNGNSLRQRLSGHCKFKEIKDDDLN